MRTLDFQGLKYTRFTKSVVKMYRKSYQMNGDRLIGMNCGNFCEAEGAEEFVLREDKYLVE